MPKIEIDYSNTIFYKIYCKNESINDLYVGHTTNFVQRKCQHKQGTYDIHNKCRLYETIRNNGGWDNWNMEIIDFKNCENSYEARKIEQSYFKSLNATLNSVNPLLNVKILKNKEKKEKNDNVLKENTSISKNPQNIAYDNCDKLTCKICDIEFTRKYNFDRHIITSKHQKTQLVNVEEINFGVLEQKEQPKFSCICKKSYSTHSGLWKHKQKCKAVNEPSSNTVPSGSLVPENLMNVNVIYELIKQNNEFKTLLVEQNNKIMELAKEKSMTVNNNNNTINNNNQKFNMNFFLNEQCKDALDIMDFVNSLQLNLADLEHTGNVGYVKGVSDIFLRGLRELDVYKRPIHCSDLKREVMYVKDNNVWEKDEDKKKMKKAVHYIAGRNFKQIHEWMDQNPDSRDIKTKKHNQYMTIVNKCTGGFDAEEDDVLFNKVIANVAKEVVIEK